MTVEILPGEYTGPERRTDALGRMEHRRLDDIAEKKLNERFSHIYDRFEDGTIRMQRIEESLTKVAGTVNENNKRHSELAKAQLDTSIHIERMERKSNQHFESLDASMAENTEVTRQIKELLDTAKGAFRFFGYLGNFLKWTLGLGGAALAFWVALRDFRGH